MLAKGSFSWIGGVFIYTIITGYITFFSGFHSNLFLTLFFTGTILSVFFLIFFRDPERTPEGDDDDMVSPADGKVISINKNKICIFMNIHNVHVNRAPLSGIVRQIDYKPGGFIPAFDKDSHINERNHVVIGSVKGTLELTQIAGILTRRIVSYISEGNHVGRGERIGMIRFGSRVDVIIPEGYEFIVERENKVKAGQTVIARTRERTPG